jgi:hypothetical protein
MQSKSMDDDSAGLELATFTEVLYAFSSLQSASGRKRAGRRECNQLPWLDNPSSAEQPSVPAIDTKSSVAPAGQPVEAPPPRRMRRGSNRCRCGRCHNCLDNARWERIFREKFANADYYKNGVHVRYASPLSSF